MTPPPVADAVAPRAATLAWLGDVLDAVRLLGVRDEALAEVAQMLGLVAVPMASGGGAGVAETTTDDGGFAGTGRGEGAAQRTRDGAQDLDDDTPAPAPPAPAPDAVRTDHRLPSRFQAVAEDEQADAGRVPPPGWAGLAPLRAEPLRARPLAPLLPPSRRRALLAALLATTVPEGEPDLRRLVDEAASGRPLTRLPRRPRRTLRRGVDLRIDGAAWLAPFAADQAALAQYLGQLLPPGRLRVQRIQASPQALPPPRGRQRQAAAALPLQAGAPVLLLSDLGAGANVLGPPPASAADWRRWAQPLQRQGRRVLALSPRPDAALARATGIAVWHWHEGLRLQAVWHGQAALPAVARSGGDAAPDLDADLSPGERRLLQLVSPALRITPWLLRAARRAVLPALPPAAEADFSAGPAVDLRGHDALVLDPVLRRAVLDSLDADTLQQALALLRASWQGRQDLTVLEEQLAVADLEAGNEPPDDDALAQLLAPAMKALAAEPGPRGAGRAARELAGWVVHAWQRLPTRLRARDSLRQLAFAAARHLGSGQALADAQGRPPLLPTRAPWLLPAGDAPLLPLSIELRRYGDGRTNLVIGPPRPPTTALHAITLPLLGPPWLEVSGGEPADGADRAPRTVAIDPGRHTQVDVAASHAGAPIVLRGLGGVGWRLWQAQGLEESVADAWLYSDDARRGLLMLDGNRALLWPEGDPAAEPDRWLLEKASFRPVQAAQDRSDRPPTEDARSHARWLGPLPGFPGLFALQLLDPPAGSVPLDTEARLPGAPRGGVGEAHPYLPLPGPDWRGDGSPVGLVYRGEGSYEADPRLPTPGLLLPSVFGPALVRRDDRYGGDTWVPTPIAELARAARGLAPGCQRALIVALPGATRAAHALWDDLVSTVGADRVAHDFDDRWLGQPADRARALAACDLLLLVGQAPPGAAAHATLALGLGWAKRLLWLPQLTDGGSDDAAPTLAGWPATLRDALRQAGAPGRVQRIDARDDMAAARHIAALMDRPGGGPDDDGAAPVVPPEPPPVSLLGRLLARLDTRTDDQIGLFRVLPQPDGTARLAPATWPESGPPGLLMVHGELSDTEASFGALWRHDDAPWRQLREAYGDRLFAWRWRTVTPGIAMAARQLLSQRGGKGPGAPMHVVSHGAGGLLVELLLALKRASGEDAAHLAQQVWPGQDGDTVAAVREERETVKGLPALAFYASELRIERFVRVACPAAGTPLLGRGLDRLLGTARLLRWLPGVGPLAALLPDNVLDNAQVAPGIAGLSPGAGVLPVLTTALQTEAPLAIVAGDLQADSMASWLRSLTLRAVGLGGTDHDLVVTLGSAFGGIERRGGVDWFVSRGPDASHFRYFDNGDTRQAIVDALLHPPGQVPRFAHSASLAELQRRFGTVAAGATGSPAEPA